MWCLYGLIGYFLASLLCYVIILRWFDTSVGDDPEWNSK